ncbi:hypothetical protein GOZ89_18475 [Agrobacterium vitis]|nr:hypothetical protein [Agrobacterium vitis]MCF1454995.1 transposase [Agrobacterium vitis]MCF1469295.1 transposase [Agrobacterium vitis]MUO71705.1 hypothetical protein [Agrobacterium vitis]MUO86217.1 hypothetical protein [Agrobacterium vitis]
MVSGIIYVLKHGLQWRDAPIVYDKALHHKRHLIENMFARIKDWRRISTRYDRCAHTFLPSKLQQLAAAICNNEA